jgi:hypothetical protein
MPLQARPAYTTEGLWHRYGSVDRDAARSQTCSKPVFGRPAFAFSRVDQPSRAAYLRRFPEVHRREALRFAKGHEANEPSEEVNPCVPNA